MLQEPELDWIELMFVHMKLSYSSLRCVYVGSCLLQSLPCCCLAIARANVASRKGQSPSRVVVAAQDQEARNKQLRRK